jgi:hypothetical protein
VERVRFLTHQGKQVLLVDYSGCARQTVLDILKQRQSIVLAQPPGSVLLLVDVTGSQFSKDEIEEVKKVAVLERSRVKRAAVVGVESVPKVLVDAVQTFAVRDYHPCPTREAALDWLVQEDAGPAKEPVAK